MGRKPAPQPLALSEPTAEGDSQNSAGETLGVPSPSSLVSSKSSKSPRSPFRFGSKKSPSIGTNTLPTGSAQSQPSSPTYTYPAQSPAQPTKSAELEQQYQPIDEAIHRSLLSTPTSPDSSNSNSNVSTTNPATSTTTIAPAATQSGSVAIQSIPETSSVSHHQQQHQHPHPKAFEEEGSAVAPIGKSTKSGSGRLFHFSKSSRPSHQHPSTPHKNNSGGHTASASISLSSPTAAVCPRSENMLKDSERPAMPIPTSSSKSSKHSEAALLESFDGHKSLQAHSRVSKARVNSCSKAIRDIPLFASSVVVVQKSALLQTGDVADTVETAAAPRLNTPVLVGVKGPLGRSSPIDKKSSLAFTSPVTHDAAKPPLLSASLVSNRTPFSVDHSLQKSIPSQQQNPSKSDLSLASTGENDNVSSTAASTPGKRGKPKPFALLNRTRSNHDRDIPSPQDSFTAANPTRLGEPERPAGLKTAPVSHERSFRDMMNSAVRNRSEDRGGTQIRDNSQHREEKHSRTQPSSFKDNSGSNFLTNLRNSSRTAADMFSKGIFGKNNRSGSTNEKEQLVDDEHYQLKVINLPLIAQARLTRISKRLEDSRDKTEFWMPAFPWRAIDYLNYKGCDVEGLYRVPGSGPQVKKWQRKFDEEYDVDLFLQDDLYDINIVGSMLKAWLRELPDELFPKEAQERIARECAGAESVPELLIEELSLLPPFHYYLLFAITCHLSLLLAHSDKNKMDFRNLCICFQPCMKIDAFCFKFLVCDWRDCWKGCKNEAKYIEVEYMLLDQPPPQSINSDSNSKWKRQQQPQQKQIKYQQQQDNNSVADERAVSSSDSKQSAVVVQDAQKGRLKKKPVPQSDTNGSVQSHSAISTALTINSERETPVKQGELTLPPLSPIKPLSPLGF
ncbi:hypothetical protein MKZ38_007118 [Zalerion maritima]|uniref:Rho-GAP domain-containing protein n=1 Tax=Zalerion maritima TaxID=339359 RepID=A0AAD5WNE3_9PEZI|nr:hypothetical protein MKZ38_007118 [Zalerion maritima]